MKLVLDEMISSTVAVGLGHMAIAAAVLVETEHARTGLSDEGVLAWAAERGETVVTNNARDFVKLPHAWAWPGRRHARILLVSPVSVPPNAPGALQRSLAARVHSRGGATFDGVEFLPRS